MMRSLFAGVAGLQNHQTKMDVLGNNISNVNTAGYKASRTTFAEMFNQTLEGAAAPDEDLGGSNPIQVGLGSVLSSIDTVQSQGNLQTTGADTDMAIEGAGFFVLRDGEQTLYTRAGAFKPDADGYLVTAGGQRVQGWRADSDGELPRSDSGNLEDIRISLGESLSAEATGRVVFENNLQAGADESWMTPVEVFDSQGNQHTVEVEFIPDGTNEWDVEVSAGDLDVSGSLDDLRFNEDGTIDADHEDDADREITIDGIDGAGAIELELDLSGITQFSGSTTVSAVERDGFPAGTLENFTIDAGGQITGVYSNGRTQTLGQVGMAAFSNPGGLTNEGSSMYRESNNSGLRQLGPPDTGPRGTVAAGALEMSNVDLSEQFTEMVITQRGFQANSRIITTSDEMLQELTNLKR